MILECAELFVYLSCSLYFLNFPEYLLRKTSNVLKSYLLALKFIINSSG